MASDAVAAMTVTSPKRMRDEAELVLRALAGQDARLREDQWMAIEALVARRRRVLCVQRTGWGKSAVYFVATALLRRQGAGLNCARNSLKGELQQLQPRAVCALGQLPHRALRALWPEEIPERVVYGQGWMGTAGGIKILITAFPNTYVNPRGVQNRACPRWTPQTRP
jgi:hypothetical protein